MINRNRTAVWLPEFDGLPDGDRPKFIYRRATADEWERLESVLYREAPGELAETGKMNRHRKEWIKDYRQSLFDVLAVGLVGLENQVYADTENPVEHNAELGPATSDEIARHTGGFSLARAALCRKPAAALAGGIDGRGDERSTTNQ